ncbi:MAG: LLM class flavin-dependent oxidoreductase [Myxococcota bacterium]|jgi:alkanesulfonate monooxygenase SsuD/methylene tetrahydromethanopterin reductase-like flavin-dependent oxidoreductase (luciferase family)|nr:LLM class flavin-dependent oxidoreductase [Myxococcota bacterium]
MNIGLCMPYMERDYGRKEILAWCRAIDSGPFSSLSCGERITGYTLEMRTVLAAAAALTERVRIMPSLYVLPMHSAAWAAKEVATLDVLSGGRVTLGVGVGGREIDYRSVGASFARRHQRMDDAVAQMRKIWSGLPAVEGADEIGPCPVQEGGPPIIAGVMGPKAMRRAAAWADGVYVFSMSGNVAEIERMVTAADAAWSEAGRESPPLKIAGFWYSLANESERRLAEYVHQYLAVFGDEAARAIAKTMRCHRTEAIEESIEGIRALGCDELILSPASAELTEVDRLVEILD